MDGFGYFLVIVVVLVAMFSLVTYWLVRRIVVPEHYVGLLYRNGRFRRRLDPGNYCVLKLATIWNCRLYDTRRNILTLSGQELLSSDNVGLKVSMVVSYEVVEPEMVEGSVQNYNEELYTGVQLALRTAIGERTIEDVLMKRDEIGREVLGRVAGEMESIGMKVHYADIKDVMFPGDLKRIFSEVVKAKKESQAVIEKARGETAALRHLANAARVLKNNQELMNLKVLQTISTASGNTYVMGVPQGIVPVTGKPAVHDGGCDEGSVET